jgi:hypothetical protein
MGAERPKFIRTEGRRCVLASAQARTVDLILVTELTRWGRSARFAARSLNSVSCLLLMMGGRDCLMAEKASRRQPWGLKSGRDCLRTLSCL